MTESEPYKRASDTYVPLENGDFVQHGRREYAAAPVYLPEGLAGEYGDKVREINDLIHTELQGEVSKSVLDFTVHNVEARMIQRDGTNTASYNARLVATIPAMLPEPCRSELVEAKQAVENGTADMRQCDNVRRILGMESIELGSITIVRDKRVEYLKPMLVEASELLHTEIDDVAPYRMEVIGFDRVPDSTKTHHLGAMRVSIKRRLGSLDDGATMKQRTIIIVSLSPGSGVDQEIVGEIFEAYAQQRERERADKLARKSLAINVGTDEEVLLCNLARRRTADVPSLRGPDYAALPRVDAMLQELVKKNMQHPIVIARNETIYVHNRAIGPEVRSRNLSSD